MNLINILPKLPLASTVASLVCLGLFSAPATTPTSVPAMKPVMRAQDTSVALKLNETSAPIELEKKEKQDYRMDLVAGTYTVFLDGESNDHKIDAELDILKKNGAVISGVSGYPVRIDASYIDRSAKTFTLKVNTGVRFRLKNNDAEDGKFWVTVVPAKRTEFVPFGFGKEVKPATVDSEEGMTGSLSTGDVIFYSATIPAGKWSYSVNVTAREGKGTAYCLVDMLDERGVAPAGHNLMHINPNNGESKREETILKVVKPRKVIIRLEADSITAEGFEYDLTIRKDEGGN